MGKRSQLLRQQGVQMYWGPILKSWASSHDSSYNGTSHPTIFPKPQDRG